MYEPLGIVYGEVALQLHTTNDDHILLFQWRSAARHPRQAHYTTPGILYCRSPYRFRIMAGVFEAVASGAGLVTLAAQRS